MADPRASTSRYGVALLALACIGSAWNWLRVPTLLYGDNLRWLVEARRSADGELAYRDFASMYPPLGIELMALVYRAFGASFPITQLFVNALSAALVFAVWRLACRLYTPALAAACAAVLTIGGTLNGGNFSLFSLTLYTPSLLLGSLGNVLTCIGALDRLAERSVAKSTFLIAVGTGVALTSKLEHALASLVTLGILALCRMPRLADRGAMRTWLARYAGLAALSLLPSLIFYAALARAAGPDNLKAGLSGYGVAALGCPLWPTGKGVVIALGCLGQATLGFAGLALANARIWRERFPRGVGVCLAAAFVGAALSALYLPLMLEGHHVHDRTLGVLSRSATYLLSLNGLLFPVLWASIVVLGWLSLRLFARLRRRTPVSERHAALLLLLASATALSSRSLFSNLSGNPAVHQSSYALWFAVTPYLLLAAESTVRGLGANAGGGVRFGPFPELRSGAGGGALVLLGAAAVVVPRIGLALLERNPSPELSTRAGPIHVSERASHEAYAYVERVTRPGDVAVEVPLGGGFTFAARLRPVLHTLQFQGVMPEPRLLDLDRRRAVAEPPALLVVLDNPGWGESHGLCCVCGCSFPRLLWKSDTLACDPDGRNPALDWLAERYRPAAEFGGHRILVPADSELARTSALRDQPARRPRASCGAPVCPEEPWIHSLRRSP